MGDKLAGIRLFRINADVLVLARKTQPTAEVKEFYERVEQIEADQVQIVSLYDKTGQDRFETFADIIERSEFDHGRLPVIL